MQLKTQKSDVAIIRMLEEKENAARTNVTLKLQKDKLEGLCRALTLKVRLGSEGATDADGGGGGGKGGGLSLASGTSGGMSLDGGRQLSASHPISGGGSECEYDQRESEVRGDGGGGSASADT
jgi:hypothetical protein